MTRRCCDAADLFNGMLYFAGTHNGSIDLWRTDGTPGGTVKFLAHQPHTGQSSNVTTRRCRRQAYFSAIDGIAGSTTFG